MFDNENEINNFLKHENYYNNEFKYKPIKDQKEAKASYFKKLSNNKIKYSIVMPIFNMEHCIKQVLNGIFKNTNNNYEIILVLDCCKDNSQQACIDFFENTNKPSNLVKITIINQPSPLFETASDNIGFRLSSGKYIIELQSDMEMTVKGYNEILTIPFNKYDDIIFVSSRGCISAALISNRKRTVDINNHYYPNNTDITQIIIDECPIRGPWAIDNQKLKEVGYLDEQNFWQAYDEADIAFRAFKKFKYVCCFYPIRIYSPGIWGASRRYKNHTRGTGSGERDNENKNVWEIKKKRSDGGALKNYCDWNNTIWPKPFKNFKSWRKQEVRSIQLTNKDKELIKNGYK